MQLASLDRRASAARTASILNFSVYCACFHFDFSALLARSLVAQQGRRFSGARSVFEVEVADRLIIKRRGLLVPNAF